MKHGSLFSGIGGFDLAAEWMGWENVFHCEIAEFPRKILNHYWPNADCHEDIKKTDFTKYRGTVDIISGGFPCQPYSAAGKRLGKEDDRHLWPEMLRVIREVKPQWVVGENVRGLLNWNGGMVFHEVCSDLENIGYEVQAFIIPASGINAPHQRERLWIVAHADNTRTNNGMQSNGEWKKNDEQRRGQSQSEHWENGINGIASHSVNYNRRSAQSRWDEKKEYIFSESKRFSKEWFTANTDNGSRSIETIQRRREEFKELYDSQSNDTDSDLHGFHECNGNNEINASERGFNALNDTYQGNGIGNASDTESQRTWEQSSENRGREDGRFNDISEDGDATDTNGIGLWGKGDRIRESKFNGKNYARNNWENFPTQSPVCSGDDGISHGLDNITFPKWRNESIKGYGNAVVPQVVYRIFKTIEYIQNLKQND
jgi:DNA (cytosine-5)-methyltransferase 1